MAVSYESCYSYVSRAQNFVGMRLLIVYHLLVMLAIADSFSDYKLPGISDTVILMPCTFVAVFHSPCSLWYEINVPHMKEMCT